MSHIPGWYALLLMVGAGFRLWKLLADDTILDGPRSWLLGVPGWRPAGHETPPDGYRERLATWLTCPWCAGFWISVVLWGLWLLWPHATLVGCVPWALSAAVGLIAQKLE